MIRGIDRVPARRPVGSAALVACVVLMTGALLTAASVQAVLMDRHRVLRAQEQALLAASIGDAGSARVLALLRDPRPRDGACRLIGGAAAASAPAFADRFLAMGMVYRCAVDEAQATWACQCARDPAPTSAGLQAQAVPLAADPSLWRVRVEVTVDGSARATSGSATPSARWTESWAVARDAKGHWHEVVGSWRDGL